jgi:Zn-dependent protease with chaperone function
LNFNAQLPDDTVNVTSKSAFSELVWISGGLSLLIVIIYLSLGSLVEFTVKKISIEQEQKLFSFLHMDMSKPQKNTAQSLKLQNLVNSTKECLTTKYNFLIHLSDANETNAFAMPGGLIVINEPIINTATSENEIFFVLAHEMGHFQNRDHLEGIGRSFVSTALASILGLSDVSELLSVSLNFSESHFSQSRESQADIFAVDLMNCYYGHVAGATDFFTHLPDESSYRLFSSHPETKKRIKIINAHINEKHYLHKEIKSF